MRRLTFLAIFISLLIATIMIGCNSIKMSSGYCPTGLKVDGLRAEEWDKLPTAYFEEQDVLVGLANDDQNLYLIFCFKEPAWARAVSKDGLTLWLNNKGKNKRTFGVKYRGVPSLSELPKFEAPWGMGEDVTGKRGGMENMVDSLKKASVEQFSVEREENSFVIARDGSNGPAAGFNKSKDIYTYEFSIPLKESELGYYGIGIKPGEELALGIEWGADMEMKRSDMGNMGERGGDGMMPPGGGGMPGGGGIPGGGGSMPGEGMGGPPGGMEKPKGMEKQEIWMKILLATGKSSAEDIAEVE